MGAHRFVALGAWGGRQATIAASQCAGCGLVYVAMNFTEAPAGSIVLIGTDGKDLDGSAMTGGCPDER